MTLGGFFFIKKDYICKTLKIKFMDDLTFAILTLILIAVSFTLGYQIKGALPNAKMVKNKDRKFGSAKTYIYAKLNIKEDLEGPIDCLFTSKEVTEANERALKNREDLPA